MTRASDREGGFTLLEVVVALAILGLSFAALFQAFSGGLGQTDRASREATALLYAQSVLDGVGHALALRDGETFGELEQGYRWRVGIKTFSGTGIAADGPMRAYDVAVTVLWQEQGRERSVALNTLRLAPRN